MEWRLSNGAGGDRRRAGGEPGAGGHSNQAGDLQGTGANLARSAVCHPARRGREDDDPYVRLERAHVGPNGKEVGTGGSWSVRVEADDFSAEDLTFENTAGDTGQAVALAAVGDRQVYRRCRMLGWQDTLYADNGRQYYDRCCRGPRGFHLRLRDGGVRPLPLHSRNGGHVTAASTPADREWGFVFLDCRLTGDAVPFAADGVAPTTRPAAGVPNADLGRPWAAGHRRWRSCAVKSARTSGRPVLSTPVADVVRQYSDLVYIEKDAKGFVERIEELLANPDEIRIQRGIAKATGCSGTTRSPGCRLSSRKPPATSR